MTASPNCIQVFRFANGKNESLFLQRKNPRKIAWTQVYRRMHKKGITEETAKKRSRRTVKSQRAIYIAGISPEAIAARQKETAAARLKQRQEITAKAKQEKSAKQTKKTTVRQIYTVSFVLSLTV